jgi:FixJ family two-component response regulator
LSKAPGGIETLSRPARQFLPEGLELRTICIVDDDDAVRDSMRVLLESHRMVVRDFNSGPALLSSDVLEGIDCFILDYQMPGMNGLELAEALRRRGVGSAAILVSALGVSGAAERLRRAGVIAALTKPLSEAELIDWIDRAVEPAAATRH